MMCKVARVNPLDALFGNPGEPSEVARLKLEVAALTKRLTTVRALNSKLKKKARRLLDVAYNKATQRAADIARAKGEEHIAELIEAGKRTVRNG